jgi:hypothetical protein
VEDAAGGDVRGKEMRELAWLGQRNDSVNIRRGKNVRGGGCIESVFLVDGNVFCDRHGPYL